MEDTAEEIINKCINCTPHDIHYHRTLPNGTKEIITIPKSEYVARLEEEEMGENFFSGPVADFTLRALNAKRPSRYTDVVGLPPNANGKVLIVSMIVAQQMRLYNTKTGALSVVAPDTNTLAVRENGVIKGTAGFLAYM